jgi:hypothetical protein
MINNKSQLNHQPIQFNKAPGASCTSSSSFPYLSCDHTGRSASDVSWRFFFCDAWCVVFCELDAYKIIAFNLANYYGGQV